MRKYRFNHSLPNINYEENNVMTRADVEQLLEVSTATAYRYLKRMTQEGLLVEKGNGKNRRYSMSES